MANEFHAGFGLPASYEEELLQLQKQRELAKLLMARGMSPVQLQQTGPVATKLPAFAALAQAAQAGIGGYQDFQASKQLGALKTRAEQEGQTEFQQLVSMSDPKARISAALASRFPGIQQQGRKWDEQEQARLLAGSKFLGDRDPMAGIGVLQRGSLDGASLTPIPAPQFGAHPEDPKSRYALTTNRLGEQKVDWAPRETNVSATASLAEDREGTQFLAKQLEQRQTKAAAAQESVRGITQAVRALERGAQPGGGGVIAQDLRKAAQFFGVNLPATASTDELQMALGKAMLGSLAALRPASDKDMQKLSEIVGSIGTDPTALASALSYGYAIALKELQGFEKYVQEQTAPIASERARQMFRGAGVGFEAPSKMTFPENWLVNMLGNYQELGGDPSGYGVQVQPGMYVDPTIRPRTAPQQVPAGVKVEQPLPRRR